MASSQVEIASSAPFGCVLRDHNRRDVCRENNARAAQAAFHKNLKNLVRDHLNTCISISPDSDSAPKENTHNPIKNDSNIADSRVSNGEKNHSRKLQLETSKHKNNRDESLIMSPRQSRILDRQAARQAREMVSTIENQTREAELLTLPNSPSVTSRGSGIRKEENPAPSDVSPQTSNLGASSLVQIWEKRLNKSNSMNLRTSACPSRSNSDGNSNENAVSVEESSKGSETGESVDERPVNDDSFPDWESDRTEPSDQPCSSIGPNSNAGESEKLRVVDIIKRLTAANQMQTQLSYLQSQLSSSSDDIEHEQSSCVAGSPSRERELELERDRASITDQAERKAFPQVIHSPRIRGRQAFTELLMQRVRDRLGELDTLTGRGAVSKFTHKGRIQSMLRLRLLQRGMVVHEQPRQQSAAPEVNRLQQGSSIMHLRERFSTSVERGTAVQSAAADPRSSYGEIVNKTSKLDDSSNPSQLKEDNKNVCSTKNHSTELIQKPKNVCSTVVSTSAGLRSSHVEIVKNTLKLDDSANPNQLNKENKNVCSTNNHSTEPTQKSKNVSSTVVVTTVADPRSSLEEIVNNTLKLDDSASPNQHNQDSKNVCSTNIHSTQPIQKSVPETRPHVIGEEAVPSSDVNSNGITCEAQNLNSQETAETTASTNGWDENEIAEEVDESSNQQYAEASYDEKEEELEESYQLYDDTNYDWISNISRPRSYWEDLRQAWYREMLTTGSDKREIRQLLERRTVSSFLTSDFRERMDRLMESRIDRQARQLYCQDDKEGSQERMEQLMEFSQERMLAEGSREGNREVEEREEEEEEEEERVLGGEEMDEDEEEEEDEKEEREASLISGQYHEVSDYFDQSTSSLEIPSPSLLRSWSYRDNEGGADSDRGASTPSPRPSQSQSYYQDSRQYSPSTNHHSIELELIYDLRGQMEQLYNEMSELRKSIKSCMDMQMMLQQPMKQEFHSVQTEAKKSSDGAPRKGNGNCCICYEVKVDSVLYRCGHMCACLKCAHELQRRSGKCPVCQAPVVDVVRVHVDT
ncbi:RING/U-box superfamily protein [Quillaja saponaria]|uniref:RING/U-box superfamily protein n=1 Tax=Quillaja saponaria TaxID=32244 RepID=A0AAD7M3P2_QUISA|nr:RING/U-box superfamily protein [Quillaja saponaria]